MTQQPLTIILAQPRGFCAGVERAIEIVEKALALYGAPIYVRHEIVHNKWVVDDLKAKGVIFVKEVAEIPDGAITVFSAHGISEKVENSAKLRDLPVIDATCPLVTKVHYSAQRYESKENCEVVLIGHKGHPEVEGTLGRIKNGLLVATLEDVDNLQVKDPQNVAYVTQTTLSVDDTRVIIEALRKRFPAIKGPDIRDICYATQNRQNAVREIADKVDLLLVVGAKNSSNSNRLRDLGEEMHTPSYLINDATGFNPQWLHNVNTVGITAGASAPEHLVQGVIDALATQRAITVKNHDGVIETTRFKLPKEVMEPVYLSQNSNSQ
ncbi:MAG: 4-hydroxy-3-methylbut-2-enyl diphosphate reductase [Alphaproteobacteria bacterium]|nr:4-hydroxy-3-methylbut-2-enyl diphosphate reductase [Alphaproteobacteria bacterium]